MSIPPTDDLDRIMAVMASAFPPEFGEAWTRRQVEDSLLTSHCHYILVDADGHIPPHSEIAAGFALSRSGFGEEELLLFAVDPEFRRRGLGLLLLRQLAQDAKTRGASRLLLEMRDGNAAESLYRSFGFTPIGKRPNYYRLQSGERVDAITFSCNLE